MDFFDLAKKSVQNVLNHRNEEFLIVSHMDADGISSCAILSKAFDRAGIDHRIVCIKLSEITSITPEENMVFCDLGSGQQEIIKSEFGDANITIIDHHQFEENRFKYHFNPFLAGRNGGSEISGSGMAYFFSKALDNQNMDLASLAVVGAVGDMQNLWGRLEGLNRIILDDGRKEGILETKPDLLLYGRNTRPIYKSLQYFTDPPIPGVSGSESQALALLSSLGISSKGEDWRTPSDLTFEEKQKLGAEIIKRILSTLPKEFVGVAPKLVFGESYTLRKEEEHSPLKDATEFSTCLNATGRHDNPEIGVEVAKGNRGIYFEQLKTLLKKHRRMLARGISLVESRRIECLDNLQYFDGTGISDNLVGTVTGLLLGNNGCDPFIPLIGYTPLDDVTIKVSLRCSKLLVTQDLNMGKIVREAAKEFGGDGGGHAFACGAYVPAEHLTGFLNCVSRKMGAISI
ncbi:MAG: DHHA1 domain-containing protein [Candidatus Methanofastidiosia archaeon]